MKTHTIGQFNECFPPVMDGVSLECPECGCREIHVEYDNGSDMLSSVRRQADEGIAR